MEPIYKIHICVGVYYLHIPSLDVRILCSAPADVVKHLIKKSLIRRADIDGVYAENGPNVILLSDLSMQNGLFSNLAEFPILQMLYKQGMLLPNHPNNTGEKPIIVGSSEQVKSQLEYIHRGNYGLVTKEEMYDAGLNEKEAEEILKMKLKFAFGKFKSPEELIEPVYLKNEPTHIKNGVYIERIGMNKFKVSYEDKEDQATHSAEVDLNLAEGDKYPSPYVLGHVHTNRDYFSIVNSGEGDGWNIAQPCMSSVIVFQGNIYLVDAGPNIDSILKALGIGLNEIDGIFHTHAHDDHFCGIISLMELDHKIKYYSTPLVQASVAKKLLAILDLEYEIMLDQFFDFCPLEDGKWTNINGLEVKPVFSPHPIETTLFQFRTLGKYGHKTYYHMADISSFNILDSMKITEENKIGLTQERIEEVKKDYLEPVDIKKIDIGGGMIHGSFNDFMEDKSKAIILAHVSDELSIQQKLVGSEVHFGVPEVLIKSNYDLIFQKASHVLKTYFVNTETSLLVALLNNEIKLFNPKTIICKKGLKLEYAYMIITGNVSTISSSKTVGNIGFGSFIGEMEVLNDIPSDFTYRTESYSSLLCIPRDIFIDFIDKTVLKETYIKLKRRRVFLQSSSLFRDFLSGKVKNEVSKTLDVVEYKKGDRINTMQSLLILHSGEAEISFLDEHVCMAHAGDFFGEEDSLFNTKTIFNIVPKTDIVTYYVPSFSIKHIPVIVQKSLERNIKMHKLIMSILESSQNELYTEFTEEHELDILMMDKQNRKILDFINICLYIIEYKYFDLETFERTFYNLSMISKHHVEYQLKELRKYNFDNIEECELENSKFMNALKDVKHTLDTKDVSDIVILKTQMIVLKKYFINRISPMREFKKSIKEYSI